MHIPEQWLLVIFQILFSSGIKPIPPRAVLLLQIKCSRNGIGLQAEPGGGVDWAEAVWQDNSGEGVAALFWFGASCLRVSNCLSLKGKSCGFLGGGWREEVARGSGETGGGLRVTGGQRRGQNHGNLLHRTYFSKNGTHRGYGVTGGEWKSQPRLGKN